MARSYRDTMDRAVSQVADSRSARRLDKGQRVLCIGPMQIDFPDTTGYQGLRRWGWEGLS